MSAPSRRGRGQPLVVLLSLLLGWAGARITSMSGEDALSLPEQVLTVGTATAAQAEPQRVASTYPGPQSYPAPEPYPAAEPYPAYAAGPMAYGPRVRYVPVWYRPDAPGPAYRFAGRSGLAQAGAAEPHFFGDFPQDRPIAPGRLTDGEVPAGLPSFFSGVPSSRPTTGPGTLLEGQLGRPVGRPSRWSMDAWTLYRGYGDKTPAKGTLPATYGASQAGGVLRYRLAMNDPRKPSAYLRTTSTLGALTETTLALGLSARPLASVPVIVALEGRGIEQNGKHRFQGALMAVTELPPIALPGDLRAEVYGQAGYVAGRYATPFADGQARVDRHLFTLGRNELRIGAGGWGGIQKGASRLDLGPGATVSVPLNAKVFSRLALDWRFRVAGNAAPGSGPAVTFGAGF